MRKDSFFKKIIYISCIVAFVGTISIPVVAQAQYWVAMPPYNTLWPLWNPLLSPIDPVSGFPTPLIDKITCSTLLSVQPSLVWDPCQPEPWLLFNTPLVFGGGLSYYDTLYGINPWPPSYLVDPITGEPNPIPLPGGFTYLTPIILDPSAANQAYQNAFGCMPLSIFSTTPDKGLNTHTTSVTIKGENLQSTPTATLLSGGNGGSGGYIISSCDTSGNANDVSVNGEYAYVVDGDSGLQVIYINNSSSPIIVGSCNTPDYACGIHVSGSYAYMSDGLSGLQVIDISDPTNPAIIGVCDTPGYAESTVVTGSYAYVADGDSGLQVIDINNSGSPTIVGSRDTTGYACGIHVSGSYAYMSDGLSGLQVIDISDSTNPAIVGSCDTPGYAESAVVTGSYAYVADGDPGLQVIDINNSSSPIIVGSCNTPGSSRGIQVSGSYAYVADYGSGLQVIDISDPTNPAIINSCDTPGTTNGIHVSSEYAYVADGDSGLQVIALSISLTNINFTDSTTITATVPDGLGPGTYDLQVTNPDGGHALFQNAFTVWQSLTEAIDWLKEVVESMNLHQGIDNSLDKKLDHVEAALTAHNAGQRQDALNKLDAFKNEVEAQRGVNLSELQADILIQNVELIYGMIESEQ